MDANDRRSSQNENGMQNVGGCADRVKLLLWDGTGLVLVAKRLEKSSFRWPRISWSNADKGRIVADCAGRGRVGGGPPA
jgi:IS66 Orf2 like protein